MLETQRLGGLGSFSRSFQDGGGEEPSNRVEVPHSEDCERGVHVLSAWELGSGSGKASWGRRRLSQTGKPQGMAMSELSPRCCQGNADYQGD